MGLIKKYQNGGITSARSTTPKDNTGQANRPNSNILQIGDIDTKKYPTLGKWDTMTTRSDAGINIANSPKELVNNPGQQAAMAERKLRTDRINAFRSKTQTTYGKDLNNFSGEDTIDINERYPEVYGEGRQKAGQAHPQAGQYKVNRGELEQFYTDLDWKDAFRQRAGYSNKAFNGAKENAKQGYTQATDKRKLAFGERMLFGNQRRVLSRAKGGILKYKEGGEACTKCRSKAKCMCGGKIMNKNKGGVIKKKY